MVSQVKNNPSSDSGALRGAVWISWENHRRSRETARGLAIPLILHQSSAPYVLRVLMLSVRTAWTLLRLRPQVAFVQNPSIVLTTVSCLVAPLYGGRVVVDRHSNFKLHTVASRDPRYRLFHLLSRWTVRRAHLTVVTNAYLAALVEAWGGRTFVLPDPIPDLPPQIVAGDTPRSSIIFVCSHSRDEPLGEVLAAARSLPKSVTVFITGNAARSPRPLLESAPENVVFTGYLSDKEYIELISSAGAVLSLTTQPHTLTCSAYEAVAVGVPLIISDSEDLKAHFRHGTVVTANTAPGIARAITEALARQGELRQAIDALKRDLQREWEFRRSALLAVVARL
jgi:glycosyltransferase involved in cell wall biosynthesis